MKVLEEAQGTTVDAFIHRITHYGSRRVEDFDKYEALRLAEDLVSVAKTSGHVKAPTYEIIASTLREKVSVSTEQFKAYFLALLADKEFSRIFDTVSKIDKSFRRASPYPARTNFQPRRGRFPTNQSRLICYKCGTPGHKAPQCWKRPFNPPQSRSDRSQLNPTKHG